MVQKVFPVLAAEFNNKIMIPFVLPNVLLIAEESNIQEYSTLILPTLRPVFTVQNPIQVCMYVCTSIIFVVQTFVNLQMVFLSSGLYKIIYRCSLYAARIYW